MSLKSEHILKLSLIVLCIFLSCDFPTAPSPDSRISISTRNVALGSSVLLEDHSYCNSVLLTCYYVPESPQEAERWMVFSGDSVGQFSDSSTTYRELRKTYPALHQDKFDYDTSNHLKLTMLFNYKPGKYVVYTSFENPYRVGSSCSSSSGIDVKREDRFDTVFVK